MSQEASCSDCEDSEEENENTDCENSDFIDNSEVVQGETVALFHQQECAHEERTVQLLKRKCLRSPKQKVDCDLSPQLNAITISPEKQPPKRRLFQQENDSGIEVTTHEAEGFAEALCCQVTETVANSQEAGRREDVQPCLADEILKSCNQRATKLARFKEIVGVSYTELTRPFLNNKTCAGYWVVAAFDVREELWEASKTLLKSYCIYFNMSRHVHEKGNVTLLLTSFKVNKSRDTVANMLKTLWQVEEYSYLADPPRLRSTLTACFWFRVGVSSISCVYGETPEWIKRQTALGHQNKAEVTFALSEMVQWALDNDYNDEPTIAYQYAKLAPENSNANAWLSSNSQARFVKECTQMVRLYKTAQMREMSMSRWIYLKGLKYKEEGNWKPICQFLKFQEVEIPLFIEALKNLLHKVPKKTCLVLYGPSNTGKSMLWLSLIRYLEGKVLSFVNYQSHFWLAPLAHAKIALIDDATEGCWDYMDTYMRNAMDGNEISIDQKHRTHTQIKCPPILLTTNTDLTLSDKWRYIRSRMTLFKFPHEMPLNDKGEPLFLITELNWKSFFERLWSQLNLSDQEEEGDGDFDCTFKCSARATAETV